MVAHFSMSALAHFSMSIYIAVSYFPIFHWKLDGHGHFSADRFRQISMPGYKFGGLVEQLITFVVERPVCSEMTLPWRPLPKHPEYRLSEFCVPSKNVGGV